MGSSHQSVYMTLSKYRRLPEIHSVSSSVLKTVENDAVNE
ncbi:584_t:CDS:2 [Funneliformis geosporum]|nr:584_t:CDS:2 [Funneliformis geosporum]